MVKHDDCNFSLHGLGYYLPKQKPLSAYISHVCTYIMLGQAIGTSLIQAEMSLVYMARGFRLSK